MQTISAAELTPREIMFFEELDRREKEEVEELKILIKEAQKIERELQSKYIRLTGCRCL